MALSDDACVVRGGSGRDPEILLETAADADADGDGPVISVFASDRFPSESDNGCLERVCQTAGLPHGKVQRTTVGQLRAAGFEVVLDVSAGQAPNHHHVFLPVLDVATAADLVDCFEQPVLNPARRRKGATNT